VAPACVALIRIWFPATDRLTSATHAANILGRTQGVRASSGNRERRFFDAAALWDKPWIL
ncbi:MAG: hypothetical protein KDE24_29630, partial [Caldilinea sp.]|nr:hypothetical protein [Caldilinea sp.]